MHAMKIGFLALSIFAAALTGCGNRKNNSNLSQTVAGDVSQKANADMPTAEVVKPADENKRSEVQIKIPSADGQVQTFQGELGVYDEQSFKKVEGKDVDVKVDTKGAKVDAKAAQDVSDLLYVASIDEDANTLVAVLYKDTQENADLMKSEVELPGVAHVFKRKNANEPYIFQWSKEGLNTQNATVVDTYMSQHPGVSLDEAVVAAQVEPGYMKEFGTDASRSRAADKSAVAPVKAEVKAEKVSPKAPTKVSGGVYETEFGTDASRSRATAKKN